MLEKSQLNLLVKHINEFDCYYEMSDYSASYMINKTIKKSIKNTLDNISSENKEYILNNLNENGKECFKRYFYEHAKVKKSF